MENKKNKNILFIAGVLDEMIPSIIEIIKELISLGHNVTCYNLDKFTESLKETGAKLKPYPIDKSQFEKLPLFIVERVKVSIMFKTAYEFIFNDYKNSEEKYDFLLYDCYFDGTEINKILKIPTIISLYTGPLEEKFPFIEITKQDRIKGFKGINQKYNINIRDFLSVRYIFEAKYNIMLSSKLFQQKLKMLKDDTFSFIGPTLEKKPFNETFTFKKDENKKLINISIYSVFHNNTEFYKMCIDTFRNSKEFQVILDVQEKVDIKQLGDLPENISVFKEVPQHQILPMTDVFITDSRRMYVISRALFINKLPLILIKQENEYLHARLIERLEAGISYDIKKLNNENLIEVINSFISNKSKYMNGVENIVKSFKEARDERKIILEKIFS